MAANAKVKHAEFGATFFRNDLSLKHLPVKHSQVVWEMSLDTVPPPSLNVLKPKFWLLGKVELESGKWYLLK